MKAEPSRRISHKLAARAGLVLLKCQLICFLGNYVQKYTSVIFRLILHYSFRYA